MKRISLDRIISLNPNNFRGVFNRSVRDLEHRLNIQDPESVAYAASVTFNLDRSDTMDVAALTGNITSITISNPNKGQIWRVIFLQDGTGGRTVAGWPSTVKLTGAAVTITSTASVRSVLTFVYDGTNHVEVSRALDVR
tara:strand:- start:96 stop:512 length:417 start_codon:yes stop_codon:yes gene_type:complete